EFGVRDDQLKWSAAGSFVDSGRGVVAVGLEGVEEESSDSDESHKSHCHRSASLLHQQESTAKGLGVGNSVAETVHNTTLFSPTLGDFILEEKKELVLVASKEEGEEGGDAVVDAVRGCEEGGDVVVVENVGGPTVLVDGSSLPVENKLLD
ncbi:hypothetical protein A2U01_0053410, partial [Trifolium medium]|nr:hypothetical protein [Trifolium medium]